MSIVTEGQIKNDFRGFKNRDTVFEFTNGHKWKQDEYHYQYHYAFRPNAKVVETNRGFELFVEGIQQSILVKKIR
jgi:hypothetical protein